MSSSSCNDEYPELGEASGEVWVEVWIGGRRRNEGESKSRPGRAAANSGYAAAAATTRA